MRAVPGKRDYQRLMASIDGRVRSIFEPAAEQIVGIIATAGDEQGQLRMQERRGLQERAGALLMRLYVPDGSRYPYAQDGVTPLSPIARILNEMYAESMAMAVKNQRNWMQRNIPDDVYEWMAAQPLPSVSEGDNPYLRRDGETREEHMERLKDLRIFRPNPMAEYEPMHTWVDPRGYELSDRIWQSGVEARRTLDKTIAAGIRDGMGARDLARLVEPMLLPGERNRTTRKPYGQRVNYSAMRLARTEIARAANNASFISAYLNPYVEKIDVYRSATGDPTCPICPQHATIGTTGERLRPAYSIHAFNSPPFHPHCKCRVQSVVTDDPDTVTARLRGFIQSEQKRLLAPILTPAQGQAFVQRLLGRRLYSTVGQVVQPMLL